MTQQFLHCANVGTRLQQMGSKAVTQGMNSCMFGNTSLRQRPFEMIAKAFVKEVVTALNTSPRINRELICRKHPMP